MLPTKSLWNYFDYTLIAIGSIYSKSLKSDMNLVFEVYISSTMIINNQLIDDHNYLSKFEETLYSTRKKVIIRWLFSPVIHFKKNCFFYSIFIYREYCFSSWELNVFFSYLCGIGVRSTRILIDLQRSEIRSGCQRDARHPFVFVHHNVPSRPKSTHKWCALCVRQPPRSTDFSLLKLCRKLRRMKQRVLVRSDVTLA